MCIVGVDCVDWEDWSLHWILGTGFHNTLYTLTYHYNNNIITMQLYKYSFLFCKKLNSIWKRKNKGSLEKNRLEKVPKVWQK